MSGSIENKITQMRNGLKDRLASAAEAFNSLREREIAASAIPVLSRDAELQRMLSRRIQFAQQSSVVYNGLPHQLNKNNELA